MSLPLEQADMLAARIVAKLGPACDRIQVAGSVRRRRPLVKDLEIVAISKIRAFSEQETLFSTKQWTELEVWHALEALRQEGKIMPISPTKPSTVEIALGREDKNWSDKRTGAKYLRFYVPITDAVVDLFLVTPETWGVLFTIRTGSADFSQAMVEHWLRVSEGGHVKDGRAYAAPSFGEPTPYETPEEEDFFRLCQLTCIPPAERVSMPDGWAKTPDNRRRLLKTTGALGSGIQAARAAARELIKP